MAEETREGMGFIGALWDRVSGFFLVMWEHVASVAMSVFPWFVERTEEAVKKTVWDMDNPLWDLFIGILDSQGALTKELREYLEKCRELPSLSGLLALGATALPMIASMLRVWVTFGMANMTQSMNQAVRPALADPMTLIRSAFIAPEKTGKIREYLSRHGFSDEQMDYLFLSAYALYDVEQVRQSYLREVIDKDTLYERMRELGFTDTRIGEIVKTWEVIPGPADLFHLVAKEAFEPDMIEKIGLHDEFPTEQLSWLKKQGISEYWAEKYWYAHWDQPSIQMGFEMLHRGEIDFNELDMLFRAVEIPPFWRDKLTKITYHPYTRVDVRRMYNFGVVDVKEVYTNYRHLGYDDEHAMKLTEWTIAQSDPDNKDISLGQILGVFESHVIERADAKALIQDLGYTADKAEFLLVSKEYEMAEALQKKELKVIEERYTGRLIDKFEALRKLSLMNLPAKQVDLLLETWDLDLLKDRKIPSKTDLEKFFLAGIIKEPEYREEMDKLGYSIRYTDWYFKLLVGKKGS